MIQLPLSLPGMRIGLLGGSFDPAHRGHVHITRAALARFRLDRIWWLVSPGNPLKPDGPAPMADRIAAARQAMQHPRVVVTDIEAQIGTRYTAQTLGYLVRVRPRVHFVWLMGADNLASFHRWQDWQDIFAMVPVGVFARPGEQLAAQLSPAARMFRDARIPAREADRLAVAPPPAWCFVTLPLDPASSTAIRAAGRWRAADAGVTGGDVARPADAD